MANKIIENKIIQLSIDDSRLTRGLQNAMKGLSGFDKSVNSIKSTGIDNVGKSATTLGSKISGMISHIPIVGKVSDAVLGIGKSAIQSGLNLVGLGNNTSLGSMTGQAGQASSAVEGVGMSASNAAGGFNVLAGAASVALGNTIIGLGSKAMAAINQFTLAPVIGGFKEYEKELESTRVLTGALGEKSLPQINAVMRDLEKYAQTTKYSSQQMNSSLAQFVNAGIDIDKAGIALKGWGNLAASAAASTDGFNSSLQYGIQQSLSMGYMTKQNWNSVTNAHMDTIKFKEELIEAGLAQGTLNDALVDEYGIQNLFNEGLAKEQWLTNDVLMSAMELYATKAEYLKMAENIYTFNEALEATGEAVNDAWSKVWVELIGKGDEAMAIWTPVGMAMGAIATAIPMTILKIAQAFNLLGGRKVMIDAFIALIDSVKLALNGIKLAFQDVFPSSKDVEMKSKSIADGIAKPFITVAKIIIDIFQKLHEKFTANTAITDAFRSVFTTLFNVIQVAVGVFGVFVKIMELLIPDNIIQNGIILIGIFASLINGVINFGKALLGGGDTSKFTDAFDRLSTAVSRFWDIITNALGAVGKAMSSWSRHTGDSIDKTEAKFSVLDLFVGVIDKLTDGVNWLTDTFIGLGKSMKGISIKPLTDLLKTTDEFFKLPKLRINNPFKTLTVSADEKTVGKKVDAIGGHLGRARKDAENTSGSYTNNIGRMEYAFTLLASKLGMDTEKVHEYWTNMSTTLHNVGENISNSIDTMVERFKSFFDVINFSTVSTFFSSSITAIGNVFEWLGDVIEKTSGPASRILTEFASVFNTFIKGLNTSSLLDISQLILLWKVINKLDNSGDIIDKLKDKIEKFKDALMFWKKGDIGFFGEIKDTMRAYQRQLKAQSLKDIAKALLIMAAAMFTLSLIPANKVGQVAKLMMVLAGSLTVLAVAVGLMMKLSDDGGKTNIMESLIDKLGFPELKSLLKKLGTAAMILALAGGVMMIGKALSIVTQFSWEEIGKGLVTVGAVMLELVLISRLAGKGASLGDAAKILALAFAVKQMIGLIEIVNKIDYATLTDGLIKLAAIGLVLGAILILMGGKAKVPGFNFEWGKVGIGTSATLLALTLGLKLLVGVVDQLEGVKYASVKTGLRVVKELGFMLAECIALMGGELKTPGGLSVSLGKVKLGAVLGLVAMTLSIKSLANTVMELGKVPIMDLIKGTAVVKSLAIVLAAVVSLLGLRFEYFNLKVSLGKVSLGAILGIAAATLGIMGLARTVAKLGEIPKDQLQNGLTVVKVLAVVMAALVLIVGNFANMSVMDVGGMLVTVGGLILLAGTLMKLTEYSWDELKKGMAGISVVTLAMVSVMATSKLIDVTGIAGMLIAAGSIYLLAEKMQELAQIPAETLKNAEIAIGVIALCMMGIMGTSAIAANPMAIAAMLAAALAIVAIGYSMKELSSIDLVALAAATAAVVIALGAIVAASIALTYTGAIVGLVALAASLLAIGAAAVLFGIGANLVVDALTKLWNLIKVVAKDLGNFFSNLGKMISDGIANAGPALSAVWSNITKSWDTFWKDASKWGDKMAKSIGKGIADAKDWVVQKAKDLWNAIINFWNGGKEKVKTSGKDTGNKFGEGVGSAKGNAEKQATNVSNAVKNKLSNKDGLHKAGGNIISTWWDGLTETYNSIVDKAQAMGEKIKGFFTGARGSVGDFMENGVTKYVASLENYIGDMTLSPVVKPELDMSSINSIKNQRIIAAPLDVQYNNLNTASAQMTAQQNNIGTIMRGMDSIYETINDLVDVNNTQADLLAKGRTPQVNIDGDRITKKLAPRMTSAIDLYNQDINRQNGKLADI